MRFMYNLEGIVTRGMKGAIESVEKTGGMTYACDNGEACKMAGSRSHPTLSSRLIRPLMPAEKYKPPEWPA